MPETGWPCFSVGAGLECDFGTTFYISPTITFIPPLSFIQTEPDGVLTSDVDSLAPRFHVLDSGGILGNELCLSLTLKVFRFIGRRP